MKKVKIFIIVAFIIFFIFALIVSIYLNNNYKKLQENTKTTIDDDSALHILDNFIEEKEEYDEKELYYLNFTYFTSNYTGSANSIAVLKRVKSYVLNFLPYYNKNIKNLSLEELEDYVENNKFYLIENAGITKAQELENMKEVLNKVTADLENEWLGVEFIPETCEKNNEEEEYFTCDFNIKYRDEDINQNQILKITLYVRNSSSSDRPTYKFVVKEYSNEE